MLTTIFFLAGLGLAFGSDCATTYSGECHSIYEGCPSGFSHYTFSGCGFLSQCCYNTRSTSTVSPGTGNTGTCGTRDYTDYHRIVGGTLADRKEYPWQVSIRYLDYHICGGTLIDSHHVLTAAHCFQMSNVPLNYWSVAIGVNDITYVSHSNIRTVSGIYHHANFNNITNWNDIAIMKLSKPVDLTGPYARAACLPQEGESTDNRICTVTGWGHTQSGGHGEKYLREVDIPIITNDMCSYYLERFGRRGIITEKQICAGLDEGGKDACQGDSGGPLVCFDQARNAWKVMGIVSWGYGCAMRYTPGVYTRVSSYLDWIHQAVRQ
ncbi:trypsin-3-like [Babylonia areolata]|uniref:trypsin-3-like n=1 Tax=Babylonia areolata TaxID=304850 RepID=UPI003FCF3BA7